MRIAIWTETISAFGRIHRSLKARLEKDGHQVDMYNWKDPADNGLIKAAFLNYDRVISNTEITRWQFDMSNPHIRARIIAVAHAGLDNDWFVERFEHVSSSTPIAVAGAVSLDAINFFSPRITQPLTYLPCGVETQEFVVSPPPRAIKTLGFVGRFNGGHPAMLEVKRPHWMVEIARLAGCELTFIYERPASSRLYDGIDMLICTSTSEGGPLGMFEAAAAGIPVISTRVGNVGRLKHIQFFDSPQAAADIITRLNSSEQQLAQYTAAVTAEVRRRFCWDKLYAQHWRPLFQGPGGSRLNFLEIGTADFDTCAQSCVEDARGLSVEPLQVYLDQLPSKPGVTKVQQAVSDIVGNGAGVGNGVGDITIYYVEPHVITQLGLPPWCRGCNTVGAPYPLVVNELRRVLGPDASEQDILAKFTAATVRATDFETLTKEHNVSAIDFLKINTVGHDCAIMRSALKACMQRRQLFPRRITFKSNGSNAPADVAATVLEWEAQGYYAERGGDDDTVLIRTWE